MIYRVEDVKDVWDVVGENTDYVDDPEEIMASSLALAILNMNDGYEQFANPEILERIVEYLKK